MGVKAISKKMRAAAAVMAVFLFGGASQAAEESLRTRAAPAAPEETSSRFPNAGLGLRVGVAQAMLKSRRLPRVAELVSDDVNDSMMMLVPTAHVGGDRFFFKADVPLMRWDDGYTFGLGIYPLNYGHYLPRSRLFPYASAGGALSIATLNASPEDRVQLPLRAMMLQLRMAAGMKWRAVPGVAVSLEAGFSPYAAGGVVDDRRRREAEAAMDAGRFPDLSRGNRPVNAGVGQVMDLAVGVEWL